MLERNARDEMAYQYFENEKPGVYTVYVQQFIDGAYRVISNEVAKPVEKARWPCRLHLLRDRMVNRTLVEDELNASLRWQVLHNGQQVLSRNARNQTQFRYFGERPGRYEISVMRNGKRISNLIRYSIEEDAEKPSRPPSAAD